MEAELKEKLTKLTTESDVMLFMKGDKYLPRCGFSGQVVDILKNLEVDFTSFDILEDPEVRQGLKEFSNWPTFPQLYYKGELVGGCDIIKDMYQNSELKQLLCPQK
jgi:monothiol glutaredoxin